MLVTVDDLMQEIRDQAEEQNEAAKSDEAILRVLNRGWRLIHQVLAVEYADPLLASATLDLESGEDEYDIPEDSFEDRVEYIEISVPGSPQPTRQRSYRDGTRLYSSSSATPFSWHVQGRKIVFQQVPTGAYDARIFYVRRPEQLVVMQGQISTLGDTHVVVDAETLGGDVTADGDELGSYINFVDRRTGLIHGTYQIASLADNRINLRTTPVRTTVLGKTVTGSASFADTEAEVDDYVCLARGTCVPTLQDTLATYLVQYCVSELCRANQDESTSLEQQVLDYARARVEAASAGRESTTRVRNRSAAWPSHMRRLPRPNSQ